MPIISLDEFENRLEALCLGRGGRGLPRRHRDQNILLKSIELVLESNKDYTENELNEALKKWLTDIGQAVEIDHVTLRRHLVDGGYLYRDRAGLSYKVCNRKMADLFEPAINTIDPAIVIENALKRREQRKRHYLNNLYGIIAVRKDIQK